MSGLYYPQQHSKDLIGSKNPVSFEITPATLTALYSGNSKIITCDYMPQITVYVLYTVGTGGGGNSIQLKFEFSADGINFSQETVELPTPANTTEYITEKYFDNNGASVALTAYKFRIPIQMADRYFKVSAKETVVGGSAGTAYVEALLSGK